VVSITGRVESAAAGLLAWARPIVTASRKQPVKQIIAFFMGLVLKIHP
jgi:hypothetical protein